MGTTHFACHAESFVAKDQTAFERTCRDCKLTGAPGRQLLAKSLLTSYRRCRSEEELVELGVDDPAIGGRLGVGEVEVSVSVDADSLDDAQAEGSATIRSAIHAAGGATPGWRIDWTAARTHQELAPACD